jgi:SMC interacting uncharacterized protein involved in chromosome segregation
MDACTFCFRAKQKEEIEQAHAQMDTLQREHETTARNLRQDCQSAEEKLGIMMHQHSKEVASLRTDVAHTSQQLADMDLRVGELSRKLEAASLREEQLKEVIAEQERTANTASEKASKHLQELHTRCGLVCVCVCGRAYIFVASNAGSLMRVANIVRNHLQVG